MASTFADSFNYGYQKTVDKTEDSENTHIEANTQTSHAMRRY